MAKITKKEIVKQMHDIYGYRKANMDEVLDDFFELLYANIAAGNMISFDGFGRFESIYRKERVVQNVWTKEDTVVSPCFRVKFTAGKKMKAASNKNMQRFLKSPARLDAKGRVLEPDVQTSREHHVVEDE